MAAQQQNEGLVQLPLLPSKHADWISYAAQRPDIPMLELLAPFKQYDQKLREIFAQHPAHPALSEPNIAKVFAGNEQNITIRARNLDVESEIETQRYLMPLKSADRRPHGSPAIVTSLKTFQKNFQLFSESSLVDMDWSNVVVAGSAVLTSLLPVPAEHGESKRSLREYYHHKVAPASDVDLFLYDLTESQAVEKIKQIEQRIRDSVLSETTTIRTKNAITIASQHPTRHVQIVLRIYSSISEILTGFDVDCACVAYDGEQVYASPRALAACMTQINTIDLTRRSPSYENRLSKYSHRGFEIYWPELDRSRIDPTIFERSFGRTLGLARLLVLEKLPKHADREAYVDQRRSERGRPPVNRWGSRVLAGNMKEEHDDEVAEWEVGDQISDYHTFTIPYGPKFHARKIERLLYAKDLLLNAEWNRPKERETTLHRHPAFFGYAADVIRDCCGHCPKPESEEDREIASEEGKIYVSGDLTFIKDDPGRQAVGSFHPLTDNDWTEMAYTGNTARLCQAIVDKDLDSVQDWLSQESANPDTRDYTGRAPIHLAVTSSTPEIVQCLIDAGARIVARLVDGKTALHLAAMRGETAMVKALLMKSEANEEIEIEKQVAKRAARTVKGKGNSESIDTLPSQSEDIDMNSDSVSEDGDVDMVDNETENVDATTENSIVRVDRKQASEHEHLPDDADKDDPDVYDVNVLAWDVPASALHFAIVNGHTGVVKMLVQDFGADVLLPIKLLNDFDKSPRAAILPLVLALHLPLGKAEQMTRVLVSLGASPAQADVEHVTALQYCTLRGAGVLDAMITANRPAAQRAANHLSMPGHQYHPGMQSALQFAIQSKDIASVHVLLDIGARAAVDFADYVTSYKTKWDLIGDSESNQKTFRCNFTQPVLTAVQEELPEVVLNLLDAGADINTLTTLAWQTIEGSVRYNQDQCLGSLLDLVREKRDQLRHFVELGEVRSKSHYFAYRHHTADRPKPLESDSEYFKDVDSTSYTYWSFKLQLEDAKMKYKQDLKQFEEANNTREGEQNLEERKNAVKSLLAKFNDLESKLVDRGAKMFIELYPNTKVEERQQQQYSSQNVRDPEPWKPSITFRLPDLDDERRAGYAKLFQACWTGQLSIIKELTLAVWNGNQSPLKIAISDSNYFSPLSIAILRGHLDVAKAILEIAHAQYVPKDEAGRAKYSVQPTSIDDFATDSADDDAFQIYSEIVGDRFTIEDIGEVQNQVKSDVTPLQLLYWYCPVSRFFEDDDLSAPSTSGNYYPQMPYRYGRRRQLRSSGRQPWQVLKHARNMRSYRVGQEDVDENVEDIFKPRSLFQLAIFLEDSKLLSMLMAAGEEYTSIEGDVAHEAKDKFFRFDDKDFLYAIRLGRLPLLDLIIRRTGAGIPLNDLVKENGTHIAEAPKYYQGLSVYGEKRADWANAGRDEMERPQKQHPPLLHAARLGNLKSVEWFMSDAANRCYTDFVENHRDDKVIQNLAMSAGGLEAAISNWLTLRSKLVMHCVILGQTNEMSLRLLRWLCNTSPKLLEQKSANGFTPLHLAFALHRIEMIKILVEAGADQTCRNRALENIVHSALKNQRVGIREDPGQIRSLLSLVDKRLLPSLFTERTRSEPGAATPLAQWLHSFCQYPGAHGNNSHEKMEEFTNAILEFSGGEDLAIINGEGDTPLHAAIRYNAHGVLRGMLKTRPELLFRENATGRTPFEMAEDAHLSKNVFNDPPFLPNGDTWNQHPNRRHLMRNVRSILDQGAVVSSEPKDLRSDSEKVWDTCEKYALKAESRKRKLVGLIEASEVARRLASRQRSKNNEERCSSVVGSHDENGMEDDSVEGDEVVAWYSMALART